MLLYHTQNEHVEFDDHTIRKSENKGAKVEVPQIKKEAEKCPHCFKRFSIEELPIHVN